MQCPNCSDFTLDERHSHGIEVDVCPNCEGVWLDRGELSKLMAAALPESRLAAYVPLANPSDSSEERVPSDRDDRREDDDDDDDRKQWRSDRRSRDRGHEYHDDDDDDDRTSKKAKKSKKRRSKSWGDRLEDVLDDVLDLDDLFD